LHPGFLSGHDHYYPSGADIIAYTESTLGHEVWHIEYPPWNRGPLNLTSNWSALTRVVPVVATNVIASAVYVEGPLQVA